MNHIYYQNAKRHLQEVHEQAYRDHLARSLQPSFKEHIHTSKEDAMKTYRTPKHFVYLLLVGLLLFLAACSQAPAPTTPQTPTPEEPTLSAQASTATICVIGGACHPSLQAAINAANAGDTIELGAGVDTEAGIVITKNLTIRGQSASQSIVQAADSPRTASNRVFLVNGGVTATLKDITVRHGYIADGGGGILNHGNLTLRRVTVSQNGTRDGTDDLSCRRDSCDVSSAGHGGGIYNNGGLTILNSTISDNFTGRGGNLVRIVACTGSSCGGDSGGDGGFGGGIYNNNTRTLVMNSSTLSGNSTGAGGTCSGPDCSFSGFTGLGGGLQASVQFAHLNNVTITGNRGRFGGGITHIGGGGSGSIVTLKNSIVAGNLNENGAPSDCASSGGIGIVSEGYNLVGAGTFCPAGGTGDLTTSNVGSVLNPTLANNGGSTFTHALVAGSAAINAGNPAAPGSGGTACLQADQRAFVRPDRCDIGAFEFNGTPDTTAPDTSITANPTNPTNSPDASFSFTGTDSGSGVEGFDCNLDGTGWMECSSPKVYNGLSDGSHTFQVRAIDNANNKDASPASYTWVIDATPPSVTVNQASGQADPTLSNPVLFTAVFSEAVSGFTDADVSLSGTANLTGASITVTGGPSTYSISVGGLAGNGTVIASIAANTVTDAAGNGNTVSTSTDNTVTFIFDTTPPVITANVVGTLGNNGWYTSDVTVSWTVTDGESTVSNQTGCEAQTVTTNTAGVTFTCSATSAGGTDSKSVTIKRDATKPTIAFVSRTAANGAGWNNSNVTLEWSCSDATSGAVSATVSQTVSSQGSNQSATGTCTDNAGNSASNTQNGINIDKTAPTLNPVVSPNPVLLNASATVVSNASDSLSGLASQSCGAVTTNSVGSKSVSCSATDKAGNSASANANYQVIYNFAGFFSPVDNLPTLNQVKAGSAIPVKFSLSGNQGLNILASGSPSSQTIACSSGTAVDDIEQTVTAGSSSLSYDAATNTYNYVWKTNKSWANTCRQLIVTLVDGTQHLANFKFK